ncbi:MAG: CREG family protein, partial [Nitrospira sp.]|nr:CREG family protein [Nitrospira sp.]
MTSSRQHSSGPDSEGPDVPEPSHAEKARTLVYLQQTGGLSTLSRKQPGWPFGSVMPYGLDDQGQPSFLISSMAMHTQNLLGDPRASLLVTPPESQRDPLGAARVTLMGSITKVPKDEVASVRERYLARHANAAYWVDFDDFHFFHMALADIYFVGGFGSMGWVAPADYMAAAVDPLAETAADLIREINTKQQETLLQLARLCGKLDA